ncbi:MAG: hypothetical protein OHM77_10440 [Candidatus Nitricoxidivorans perseverans]|uniref:Uncharacterized protein n=1 Tax=Candidatus Nitricoxidivorans perseverans TaxID=2975601 RepID=A0AA49FJF8_9PROT|nr:MAG: hypothetical protein OHM77_10440 [Candidatus Nitricoxidivorans perseverans]
MLLARFCCHGHLRIVYCRASRTAIRLLRNQTQPRVVLQRLKAAPYHLPAHLMCDPLQRSYRCDAIETVIEVARAEVAAIEENLDRVGDRVIRSNCADLLRRYLRYQAGEAVRDHVYLGYHLLCLKHRHYPDDFALAIPKTWWSDSLDRALAPTGIPVLQVTSVSHAFDTIRLAFEERIRGPVTSSSRFEPDKPMENLPDTDAIPDAKASGDWPGSRLSLVACDGLDYRLRGNAAWAWHSGLPLSAFSFFWNVVSRRPTNLELGLPKRGAQVYAFHSSSAPPAWLKIRRRSGIAKGIGLFAAAARIVGAGHLSLMSGKSRWVAGQIATLVNRAQDWHGFFANGNVSVHVEYDYGTDAYARALAMRCRGGIVVLDQRSQYYDNYDHSSDRPGDVAFISGPHGLRYYSPRLFEVPPIVLTGMSADDGIGEVDVPNSLAASGLPTVALFDEPGTLYGPEHVRRFVSDMLAHCSAVHCYRILIKPKKPAITFLSSLPESDRALVDRLTQQGYLEVAPAETSVRAVCARSNIVVSVPSTAACIAVAAGIPTLVFNPFHTIRTMFYEHGLESRCIFTKHSDLLDALLEVIHESGNLVGQCSRIRRALDPWLDMKGNNRKGIFLSDLLRETQGKTGRQQAISCAMESYRSKIGLEFAGSWQAVWNATGGSEELGLSTQPPRYDRVSQSDGNEA